MKLTQMHDPICLDLNTEHSGPICINMQYAVALNFDHVRKSQVVMREKIQEHK